MANERDGSAASKHPVPRPRATCPNCGSAHTQPFTHGGPAARKNMKCIDCGHLFHDPNRGL